jgi:hypothetical protein
MKPPEFYSILIFIQFSKEHGISKTFIFVLVNNGSCVSTVKTFVPYRILWLSDRRWGRGNMLVTSRDTCQRVARIEFLCFQFLCFLLTWLRIVCSTPEV